MELEDRDVIRGRVAKMPPWLQDWYKQTLKIVAETIPAAVASIECELVSMNTAFRLAVVEYKTRQRNRKVYADAVEMILKAADAFEFTAGENPAFSVRVQPADGAGMLHVEVEPQADGNVDFNVDDGNGN